MKDTGKATSALRRLTRYAVGIGIAWTIMVAGVFLFEISHEEDHVETMALAHALAYSILYVFSLGVLALGHRKLRTWMEQRLLMEMALRESESRFERIATTGNIGIWEVDANARTSYVNPAWLPCSATQWGRCSGRPCMTSWMTGRASGEGEFRAAAAVS